MKNQVFTLIRLNSLLLVLFWVFMLSRAMAAELVFDPATPSVEVGKQITLSVSGTSGEIIWTTSKGKIQGAGNQVTYIAAQAGVDTVVLGCTHYPLLLPWLRKSLPEVTAWVDSGDAIARRVAFLLGESGRLAAAETPRADTGGVVSEARFTGDAPPDVALFMAEMGISVARVCEHWPGVTTAGSA